MPDGHEMQPDPSTRDARPGNVSLDDPVQQARWADHFGVAVDQVRAAVAAVGTMPLAVDYYLRQKANSKVRSIKPRPDVPRERERRRTRPIWQQKQDAGVVALATAPTTGMRRDEDGTCRKDVEVGMSRGTDR